MYKYVKISKTNFFTITILSLHSICSESKNYVLSQILAAKIPKIIFFPAWEMVEDELKFMCSAQNMKTG